MFDEWKKRISKLERQVFDLERFTKTDNIHCICASCNITGHEVDMKEVWDTTHGHVWFHNGCYAEEFNKHFCPCGCGKWIDNKPTKTK